MTSDIGYFDWHGNPIDQKTWAELHSNEHGINKIVARYVFPSGILVSTVWLGFNHQWGDGPPLIFETLVFGGPCDQEMDRYSTLDQAMKGHMRMVKHVKQCLSEERP